MTTEDEKQPVSDAAYYRIKAATRDLIKACGGVERAGEVAGYSKTEAGRWQSATALRYIIPLDAILALEADCGLALVTAVQASLNGRRLAEPDGAGGEAMAVMGRYVEAMRAATELMATGTAVFADLRLTPSEAELMQRAIGTMQTKLESLQKDLAAVRSGGPGLRVVGETAP